MLDVSEQSCHLDREPTTTPKTLAAVHPKELLPISETSVCSNACAIATLPNH